MTGDGRMPRERGQQWTKQLLESTYREQAESGLAERLIEVLGRVDALGRLLLKRRVTPGFGVIGNSGQRLLSIREHTAAAIRGRISIFPRAEGEAGYGEYVALRDQLLPIRDPDTEETHGSWDFTPLGSLSDGDYQHLLTVLERLGPVPASDAQVEVPTSREDVVISRIVRDSAIVRRLKQLYDNRCQICGTQVSGVHGWTYAEAHHVKPLGDPHGGPDREDNLLILCPNHHAACDFGAIELDASKLRFAPGHTVQAEHLRYHNERILRQPG